MPNNMHSQKPTEHIYSDFSIEHRLLKSVNKGFIHWHNTGEFILAESGVSTAIAENESVNLTAPYLIFYPPFQTHFQLNKTSPDYIRYCMSIDQSYLDDIATDLPQSFFAFNLTCDEYLGLYEYISLLYKYYKTPIANYTEAQLARRKYLLLLFLNELTPIIEIRRPDLLSSQFKYINEVCVYINRFYMDCLTLKHLAEKFFVSRTKLTHDFRSVKNISIVEYITAVRINKSKILLRDGLSIAEVAHQCGFSSSAYYIKVFDKLNSITPAKFRESPKNYILLNEEPSNKS